MIRTNYWDSFDCQKQIEETNMKDYYRIGQKVKIIYINGEPQYEGREGIIRSIDDMGQLHGTWGGLALIPTEDEFVIIK